MRVPGKLVAVGSEQGQKRSYAALIGASRLDVARFLGHVPDESRVVHVEGRDPALGRRHAFDKLLPLQILGLNRQLEGVEPIALG